MKFHDATVIVTGGARGIGRAVAERFASEGARVVIADVDENGARSAAEAIGRNARAVRTDVSSEADVAALIERAATELGGIDVVVNNAGIDLVATVDETSYADWRRMLSVDLDGAFLCIKHARPHLARRGGGAVVNIGSIHGLHTQPGRSAYAAAKAGLAGMTRALALDLGPEGIRINTIAPGYIRTEIWHLWLDELPDPEATLDRIAQQHPLRRLGRPEDIAGAVAFLASPDAAFITGTLLTIDGGLTAMFPPPPI
jgi:meso-butanediol dehydrogenase / (S,S)-butanediol dehydrogenase / diacetyl reductase